MNKLLHHVRPAVRRRCVVHQQGKTLQLDFGSLSRRCGGASLLRGSRWSLLQVEPIHNQRVGFASGFTGNALSAGLAPSALWFALAHSASSAIHCRGDPTLVSRQPSTPEGPMCSDETALQGAARNRMFPPGNRFRGYTLRTSRRCERATARFPRFSDA